MTRELDPARPLDREVRRVVRRRVRDAITMLRAATDPPDEVTPDDARAQVEDAVHSARRHCKEIRALIRLIDLDRDAGRGLDRAIRAVGHALAPVRDAHVAASLAGTVDAPGPRPTTALPGEHRAAIELAVDRLEEARGRIADLRFDDPADRLGRGLRRTYARSRRAYERASRHPTPQRLHRWRIWNKRLWYQVRFLSVTAPIVLAPLAELLDVVGETLGVVHDLDVQLDDVQDAHAKGSAAERGESVERALRWGATIHAERPAAFTERLVRYWTVASERGAEPELASPTDIAP